MHCERLISALRSSNTTETCEQTTRISKLWEFPHKYDIPRKTRDPGSQVLKNASLCQGTLNSELQTNERRHLPNYTLHRQAACSNSTSISWFLDMANIRLLFSQPKTRPSQPCHPNLGSRCHTYTENASVNLMTLLSLSHPTNSYKETIGHSQQDKTSSRTWRRLSLNRRLPIKRARTAAANSIRPLKLRSRLSLRKEVTN